MNEKAQGLTVNNLVLIVLGLIILVIVGLLIRNNMKMFDEKVGACERNGGFCQTSCNTPFREIVFACSNTVEKCCFSDSEANQAKLIEMNKNE